MKVILATSSGNHLGWPCWTLSQRHLGAKSTWHECVNSSKVDGRFTSSILERKKKSRFHEVPRNPPPLPPPSPRIHAAIRVASMFQLSSCNLAVCIWRQINGGIVNKRAIRFGLSETLLSIQALMSCSHARGLDSTQFNGWFGAFLSFFCLGYISASAPGGGFPLAVDFSSSSNSQSIWDLAKSGSFQSSDAICRHPPQVGRVWLTLSCY